MTEQEVFVLADQALKAVVDKIRDDQWRLIVPDDMTRTPGVTLRKLVDYHAYDDAWVPDMLAGRTMDEVGASSTATSSGDHPKADFASSSSAPPRLTGLRRPRPHSPPGSATGRPASTSGTSPPSAGCAPTTSPASSASTPRCRPGWSGASGTRSAPRRGVAQAGRVRTGGAGAGGRAAAGPAAGADGQAPRLTSSALASHLDLDCPFVSGLDCGASDSWAARGGLGPRAAPFAA